LIHFYKRFSQKGEKSSSHLIDRKNIDASEENVEQL